MPGGEIVSSKSQTPSKGPPPLPSIASLALATPLAVARVEEVFFLEGVDGHAESLPSSDPEIDVEATLAPTSDDWLEEEQPLVEDPARIRRRRAARVGLAW